MQDFEQIHIIESNKGGKLILEDGYQYYIHKKRKNGSLSSRCSKYYNEKCPGSIILLTDDLETVLERQPHTCKADYIANEIALRIHNCKKVIASTNIPVSAIYRNALKDEGNGIMPAFESVKHGLYSYAARKRVKKQGLAREKITKSKY